MISHIFDADLGHCALEMIDSVGQTVAFVTIGVRCGGCTLECVRMIAILTRTGSNNWVRGFHQGCANLVVWYVGLSRVWK